MKIYISYRRIRKSTLLDEHNNIFVDKINLKRSFFRKSADVYMALFSEKHSRKVGKAIILITEKRSFLKIAGTLAATE